MWIADHTHIVDQNWVTANRAHVEDFRRRHRSSLMTLLFTDIVGSTRLKQTLGDAHAVTLIQQHHSALRAILSRFTEGEEIDTAGDSFFIAFTKPSDAVKFAVLLQAQIRVLARETGTAVRDRIGIHVGEVFIDDQPIDGGPRHLSGLQVDTCARVMSLGGANQILMSRLAFDSARQVLKGEDIEGIGTLSWLNHGTYSLKGVDEPVEICEVGEEGEAALSPPGDSGKACRQVSPGDEPVLGWRPAAEQAVPNTKWILERNLGEGGFGEVWLGRHETLKKRRVFKFCFNAKRARSLQREVTIFRLLEDKVGDHPNIVTIEDVFFDEPPFYIVMEYVEGDDLRGWCTAQQDAAAISVEMRLDIVAQIANALHAAHKSGVIHRDVKPQNILVNRSNAIPHAKLADFGIGKVLSEEVLTGMTRLGFTQTLDSAGPQSGTQMYMAPEIIAGHPATARSDIYSLGVVLYQLLIGDFARPLTTDWEDEISDPILRDDLRHCFARDPDKRFTTAKELADNLRSWRQRRAAQNRRRLLVLGAICFFWTALGLLLPAFPNLPFVSAVWSGEQRFEDLLRREGGKAGTRDDFVFLGIDQSTLEMPPLAPEELANNRAFQLMTAKQFPWSREVWAILLDRLLGAGARLVMFDFIFDSPNEGDSAFHQALEKYRDRVVLAANIDTANAKQIITPNDKLIPQPPMAGDRVGYVNFWPDPIDGKVRAANFTISDRKLAGLASFPGEEVFESFATRALEKLGYGQNVPRDQRGHLIRFSANDAYEARPLYEIFDPKLWHANYKDGNFFQDKVILIGAASQIAHDVVATPMRPDMPGPVLHLQTMAAAMQGQFLRITPLPVVYALVFAAGFFAWMLVICISRPVIAVALLAGITMAYLAAARFIYDQTGLLLVTVPVLIVFLFSGFCSLGWRELILRQAKDGRRGTLVYSAKFRRMASFSGAPGSFSSDRAI
jgi:CHASE2 domain-containing sensor protein/class 3 adenylate cyclase/tRNA A-37 threonylcarbamoyl transferase component Bud32